MLIFLSLCSLDPDKLGCKPMRCNYKGEDESHPGRGERLEASHR